MSKTENPKVIGIFFGDNDFSHPIRFFLESLAPYLKEDFGLNITKENLVKRFNACASALCTLTERDFSEIREGGSSNYLVIDTEDVYFDDEVAKCLETERQGYGFNHDFHVIDSSTFTLDGKPYIYSC